MAIRCFFMKSSKSMGHRFRNCFRT